MVVVIRHKTAAIDLLQQGRAEGMVGGASAAQAAVEAEHPIASAAHHVEVMGDLQDRPALTAAQIEEQVMELLGGLGIQTSLGLIEHQQPPRPCHTKREQHPLELTAGELTEQALSQTLTGALGQGARNRLTPLAAPAPAHLQPPGVEAEAHEFGHTQGKASLKGKDLGQVGDLVTHCRR